MGGEEREDERRKEEIIKRVECGKEMEGVKENKRTKRKTGKEGRVRGKEEEVEVEGGSS